MVAATLTYSPTPDDASAPDTAAPRFPGALKDRAFDLYAYGFRSPAIATELGVSERTVRHWLQTTIQQLAQDDITANPDIARQQRALAIESQRAVAATAWTAYQQLSDAYTHLMSRTLAPTNTQPERLLAGINRLASTAARHLSVVISANREIARLQGQAVAQATREQHAASRQAEAEAADLLRILTMPIPTPSTRPSALGSLPPLRDITTPDIPTTAGLPATHRATQTATPSTDDLPAPDFPPLPDHIIAAVMSRVRQMEADDLNGLSASGYPPLPDHIIAAVMSRYREMEAEAAGVLDSDDAPIAAPQTEIPAKTATPTNTATTMPVASPALNTMKGQSEQSDAPSKTQVAAKTAMPPHHKNKPNHQPAIAIPSRTARKLKKARPA